ncbi:hypothetical protein CC80DRAFT_498978 [Byssothecium circinans]|uniref:Uncharacterized protein n=1 Tax=Byssothecium circinans TaxID=147558 RepID=A0A6A5UCK6_9PLEO|nr:hypothetical protein CC80DRAFT_498978 [Byssothecium circinans]
MSSSNEIFNRYLSTPDIRTMWQPPRRLPLNPSPSAYLPSTTHSPPDLMLPPLSDFGETRPSSLRRIDERRRKGLSTPGNPSFESLSLASPSNRVITPVNSSTPNCGGSSSRTGLDRRFSLKSVRSVSTEPDVWEQEARDGKGDVDGRVERSVAGDTNDKKGFRKSAPRTERNLLKPFCSEKKDKLTGKFTDPLTRGVSSTNASNFHSLRPSSIESDISFSSIRSEPIRGTRLRAYTLSPEPLPTIEDYSPSIAPKDPGESPKEIPERARKRRSSMSSSTVSEEIDEVLSMYQDMENDGLPVALASNTPTESINTPDGFEENEEETITKLPLMSAQMASPPRSTSESSEFPPSILSSSLPRPLAPPLLPGLLSSSPAMPLPSSPLLPKPASCSGLHPEPIALSGQNTKKRHTRAVNKKADNPPAEGTVPRPSETKSTPDKPAFLHGLSLSTGSPALVPEVSPARQNSLSTAVQRNSYEPNFRECLVRAFPSFYNLCLIMYGCISYNVLGYIMDHMSTDFTVRGLLPASGWERFLAQLCVFSYVPLGARYNGQVFFAGLFSELRVPCLVQLVDVENFRRLLPWLT